MPLTTPADTVAGYSSDGEHFVHVLDHLFIPAVEKTGFSVVRPEMTGADLIHAQIVKNLQFADVVLCDVSTHNPNVFFELGIRTALNRPICLVRDDQTTELPFDTGIINTHIYDSSLAAWTLDGQIEKLADHLRASFSSNPSDNPLWRYFGLTQRAEEASAEGDPVAAQIEILAAENTQASLGDEDEARAAAGNRPAIDPGDQPHRSWRHTTARSRGERSTGSASFLCQGRRVPAPGHRALPRPGAPRRREPGRQGRDRRPGPVRHCGPPRVGHPARHRGHLVREPVASAPQRRLGAGVGRAGRCPAYDTQAVRCGR